MSRLQQHKILYRRGQPTPLPHCLVFCSAHHRQLLLLTIECHRQLMASVAATGRVPSIKMPPFGFNSPSQKLAVKAMSRVGHGWSLRLSPYSSSSPPPPPDVLARLAIISSPEYWINSIRGLLSILDWRSHCSGRWWCGVGFVRRSDLSGPVERLRDGLGNCSTIYSPGYLFRQGFGTVNNSITIIWSTDSYHV